MKLKHEQIAVVDAYAASVDVAGGLRIWNDHFLEFESLVLGLPSCHLLGSSDVFHIAADHAYKFHSQLKEELEREHLATEVAHMFSAQLVAFLESLPRACELRVILSQFPTWGDFTIELAPGIRLLSSESVREAPASSSNVLVALLRTPNASMHGTALSIDLRGHVSSYQETYTAQEGISLAKICSFLFTATGAMKFSSRETIATASIEDKLSGESVKVGMQERLARHLGKLVPDEDRLQIWDSSSGKTLLGVTRAPKDDQERVQAFEEQLGRVSKVLKHRESVAFKPLAAAIEWYQDSQFSEDQTIAYLAACIGLESVYGEKDMKEMTKRLEDRYAFLLGKNREDRKKLAQEYAEVLHLRGELVHARLKRLGSRDYQTLQKARRMLFESIRHELNSLVT